MLNYGELTFYAEAAYFDGNHCKHVADFFEQVRLEDRPAQCLAQVDRRKHNVFVPIERRAVSLRDRVRLAA